MEQSTDSETIAGAGDQPKPNKNVPPKIHQHPCICDVKKYKRKALSPFEKKKKCQKYLREPTDEELDKPTAKEIAAAKVKALQNEADDLLQRLEERKLINKTKGLVVQEVKDSIYKMQYKITFEEEMAKRRGHFDIHKAPKITIRPTKASTLRKENRRYCGRILEFLKPKPTYYFNFNAGAGYALPTPPPPPK